MSESEIVAVGDAVIGDVLASAVEMTGVEDAPVVKRVRNGSAKLNKKALAGMLALPFVERLSESDRGMFEMMIASATADRADEVVAYFEPKAKAERSVGGVGSRAPRAFQAPKVEGVELHKVYRAELVGVWIVGRANTAGGWLARNLLTGEQVNTGIQKVAGRDVARAHAEGNSPKSGKGVAEAKARFAARTAADPKYGMVADGRMAGSATAIWDGETKTVVEVAAK